MSTATIPAVSKEYLRVDVTATGVDIATLNTLPVSFAFLTSRTTDPATADWVNGEWETGTATARVLVGPGGGVTTLVAGTYFAWMRVTGAVERPVRQVGTVRVI